MRDAWIGQKFGGSVVVNWHLVIILENFLYNGWIHGWKLCVVNEVLSIIICKRASPSFVV